MKWLLGLLWFGTSIYAGYLLTGHSFAFLQESSPLLDAASIDQEAVREKLPEPGEDPVTWFESLSAEEQTCVRASVSEERFQAAVAGEELEPTQQEMIRIAACLDS